MQKFQNSLSHSPNHCGPLRDTKISNFFHRLFHDATLKSSFEHWQVKTGTKILDTLWCY